MRKNAENQHYNNPHPWDSACYGPIFGRTVKDFYEWSETEDLREVETEFIDAKRFDAFFDYYLEDIEDFSAFRDTLPFPSFYSCNNIGETRCWDGTCKEFPEDCSCAPEIPYRCESEFGDVCLQSVYQCDMFISTLDELLSEESDSYRTGRRFSAAGTTFDDAMCNYSESGEVWCSSIASCASCSC